MIYSVGPRPMRGTNCTAAKSLEPIRECGGVQSHFAAQNWDSPRRSSRKLDARRVGRPIAGQRRRQPGPKFELPATNALGEMTNASTVSSGGEIFVRTFEHLWCIGDKTR